MNKNSFIWVVVVLLIVVFVYGGFMLVRKYQATRTLSQNQQQDKILQESFSKKCDFFKTDWNVFDHPRGNFSLQYPNCWVRRNIEGEEIINDYYFLRNDISQFSDSDRYSFRPPYFEIGRGGIDNFINRYRKSVSKEEFTFQNLPAVKEIFTYEHNNCLRSTKEKYNKIDTELCGKADLFPNIILVTIYKKIFAPDSSIIAIQLAIYYDPNDPMDYSALMDKIVSTLKIN